MKSNYRKNPIQASSSNCPTNTKQFLSCMPNQYIDQELISIKMKDKMKKNKILTKIHAI